MEKWAVITGSSSGIGRELAKLYAKRGYGIVLAARRADRLYDLATELETDTRIIPCDLREKSDCYELYEGVEDLNVTMLINCAGFGAVGNFDSIDLERQYEMTQVNCAAVMLLTHMFLKDFKYRDCGTILNVASAAGLMPGGPQMAVYYATKAYVVSLTNSIYEELRAAGSNVRIAALCPGPVDTEFNKIANVKFALKGITPQYCAKCAAWGLDRGKRIIIPEEIMQIASFAARLAPESVSLKVAGMQQKRKIKKYEL